MKGTLSASPEEENPTNTYSTGNKSLGTSGFDQYREGKLSGGQATASAALLP